MKYIGWFSCGITSAVAVKKAIVEGLDVTPIYIKINSAHSDNERFIKECEVWYDREILIIQSDKFGDQFEVSLSRKYINGVNGAPCTNELKKKVRQRMENDYDGQIFGFEFSKKEINRAVRFSEQYPITNPIFPLIESQMTKVQCAELLLKNGIQLPKMYELGYHNNNCIGCVKGGKGYWNKIRKDFPETFERMMETENIIGASCIKGRFLKDLSPSEGRHEAPIMPDCGNFCEIEFADIISPITKEILQNPLQIRQLKLF